MVGFSFPPREFRLRPWSSDCGHSPMKHVCLWNHEILGPIQKNGMGGPGDLAFKKLKILLDRMMLRRTKVGPRRWKTRRYSYLECRSRKQTTWDYPPE